MTYDWKKEHSFHRIEVIKIETYYKKELKSLSKQLSKKDSEYYLERKKDRRRELELENEIKVVMITIMI